MACAFGESVGVAVYSGELTPYYMDVKHRTNPDGLTWNGLGQ